jgi:hypothetical protein
MLAIAFLYVHFLLSYQWLREKTDFFNRFEFDGFPTSEVWAYILSIVALFYFVIKIFFGEFPLSRKYKLITYYKKLLLKDDIPFLAELVEKYHLEEVVEYLRKVKTIDNLECIRLEEERQEKTHEKLFLKRKIFFTKLVEKCHLNNIIKHFSKTKSIEDIPASYDPPGGREYEKKCNRVIKGRKLEYGEAIYRNIIINDTFIDSVANINPYLFAKVIQELNLEELKEEEFVNRYLKILMTNKNGNFFREIRNNQNLDYKEERPILYALFNDITVCSINEAWRGIGDSAMIEMQEEAKKEYSVLRESDTERDGDTVWSFRITIAIWYFDMMVKQAITQNIGKHMWMFYYYQFVGLIISNMPELPSADSELNRYSRNFDLIQEIFSKMMGWKGVIVESKNDKLIKSVYDCMGQCVYALATTDKLRNEDKHYLVNWVWENLIETDVADESIERNGETTNIGSDMNDKIINIGFGMFKKPAVFFSPDFQYNSLETRRENEKYLSVLKTLWEKRDIPKLEGITNARANRFKTEVIDALKIDLSKDN